MEGERGAPRLPRCFVRASDLGDPLARDAAEREERGFTTVASSARHWVKSPTLRGACWVVRPMRGRPAERSVGLRHPLPRRRRMPNVSKETASEQIAFEGSTFASITSTAGIPSASSRTRRTPISQGCSTACPTTAPSPRWGYVIKGRVASGSPIVRRPPGGRRLLRPAGSHAGSLRGDGDRRVQPHRDSRRDDPGRDEEPAVC